jgi:hypothetical protein
MTFSFQPRRGLVDKESGYPYTVAETITRIGTAMNQTKIGNRVVAIAGTASANEKPGYREPTEQRHTARRIIVIRNGKLVGRRRGQ